MLYVNQKDYPYLPYPTHTDTPDFEYGRKSTVSSSGCGLCSSVMVADRLIPNNKFGLTDALSLSVKVGANHQSGTHSVIYFPAFAEELGLSWETTSDPEKLLRCLRTGGCAIAHVYPNEKERGYVGVFSHGGHYITVIGEEEDGRLEILDPSYVPGKFDEPGREGKVEVVDGCICLTSMEVLLADTAGKAPNSFHLFKRRSSARG